MSTRTSPLVVVVAMKVVMRVVVVVIAVPKTSIICLGFLEFL